MECTTTASRPWRYRSAISLFNTGVELRSERIGAVELSHVQSGDTCMCGAGAVWGCTLHAPRAAIAPALRGERKWSSGGNCDPLGSSSNANRKRDLRHPAHGIVDGLVFNAHLVLRGSRSRLAATVLVVRGSGSLLRFGHGDQRR